MNANFKRIYFIRFASNFCQSCFFPFLAVWLFKEKLFLATQAAVIVSLGVLSARLCAPFLSSYVKKYDKKYIIFTALFLLSILYGIFYFLAIYKINSVILWVIISLLIGAALSLNSLSILSYLAIHQDEQTHHDGFSLINIALNLSSGLGPFFGAVVIAYDKTIFPLIPIFFSLLSMSVVIFLNADIPLSKKQSKEAVIFSLGGSHYIFFIFLNMLTFIAYAQFYDVFPVYASQYFNEKTIGLLFVVSSVVIVIAQLPVNRLLKKYSNQSAIVFSNLILGVGTLLFIAASQKLFVLCVLGVILISLAEVIYAPLYQTMAVQLYQPSNPVRALAIQSFSWGLAEAGATFLGIVLVGHGCGDVSFILGVIFIFIIFIIFSYTQGKRRCRVNTPAEARAGA